MRKVLLFFIDGVGLGDAAEWNPMQVAQLPYLEGLIGGQKLLNSSARISAGMATLCPLDATLGVDGIPQSGTGQSTLFTGRNAAKLHGRHFGPWVPAALREMVAYENVLARAARAGRRVAFANAYPSTLIAATKGSKLSDRLPAFLRAGPVVSAIGAGVFECDEKDLRSGRAVASEILNRGWRERLGLDVPEVSAAEAGATLASIANANDITLFAHYATDGVGHDQDVEKAVQALTLVDDFVRAVHTALDPDAVLVIASDHGNIEDVRTGHTRNPALGLIAGHRHEDISRGMTSLMDVAPAVMQLLGVV